MPCQWTAGWPGRPPNTCYQDEYPNNGKIPAWVDAHRLSHPMYLGRNYFQHIYLFLLFPKYNSFWNCMWEKKQELMFKVFVLNFALYFIFVDLNYCHKGPSHRAESIGTVYDSNIFQRVWWWKRTVGKLSYKMQVCALQPFIAVGPVCCFYFAFIHMKNLRQEGDKSISQAHSLLSCALLPPCFFLPQVHQQPLLGEHPCHYNPTIECTLHSLSAFHVSVPLTNSTIWEKQPNRTNKSTGITWKRQRNSELMPPLEGAVGVQKCEFIQRAPSA